MRRFGVVVAFQLRRLGWGPAVFFGSLALLLPALVLLERLALFELVRSTFETRLVVVADPPLADGLRATLADAPIDVEEYFVEVVSGPRSREPGEVLVRVPPDVFEGAGFEVEGDTASVLLARIAVEEWLVLAWADQRLGPAPAPEVRIRDGSSMAAAPADDPLGFVVVLGTLMGLLSGLRIALQLGASSEDRGTRLVVLAAGRRAAIGGHLVAAVLSDLLGRVPGVALLSVALWVFWSEAGIAVLAAKVVWICILGALGMLTAACVVGAGGRIVGDGSETLRVWLGQPLLMLGYLSVGLAMYWPMQLALCPVLGIVSVAQLASDGAPLAVPFFALHVLYALGFAELVVWTHGSEEPPLRRIARAVRSAR
ncbi:MAG: hypothetical protein H6737_22910 [Alphaproteobacteria bacterium]|nr:hypothetical protein [Alphaproteobacteria bacterium]